MQLSHHKSLHSTSSSSADMSHFAAQSHRLHLCIPPVARLQPWHQPSASLHSWVPSRAPRFTLSLAPKTCNPRKVIHDLSTTIWLPALPQITRPATSSSRIAFMQRPSILPLLSRLAWPWVLFRFVLFFLPEKYPSLSTLAAGHVSLEHKL